MKIARIKQEEEVNTRIIVKEKYEIWKTGKWALMGKIQIRPN